MTAVVMKMDEKRGFAAGIDFVGSEKGNPQVFDVESTEYSGDGQKAQQRGNEEVDEIVAGIDGGNTQKEGQDDIYPAGAGNPDYTGTASSSRRDFTNSCLAIFS